MNREERRQHREHLAELEAIADEVATELGDWSEEPAPEPGRVVGLEERRTARGISGATREGVIGAEPTRGGERAMNAKEQAKHLIEQLPEGIVRGQVVEFLEFLQEKQHKVDQVMRALAEAPLDDEPTTAEDLEAIREANEAIARGELRGCRP